MQLNRKSSTAAKIAMLQAFNTCIKIQPIVKNILSTQPSGWGVGAAIFVLGSADFWAGRVHLAAMY